MSAIEIYEKVISALGASDYEDASIALEFAQRKINNLRYAQQANNNALAQASQLQGSAIGANYSYDYAEKQAAAVKAAIVQIVRQEIGRESTEPCQNESRKHN